MTEEILKVQLPLFATDPESAIALVYNRSRKLMIEVPATDEVRAQLENEPKSFWWGSYVAGVLTLHRKAPWQEW